MDNRLLGDRRSDYHQDYILALRKILARHRIGLRNRLSLALGEFVEIPVASIECGGLVQHD